MNIRTRCLTVIGLLAVLTVMMCVGCGTEDEVEEGQRLEAQIAPIKYNRNAIVTIMSDDGELGTAELLDKLGEKYQFKITVSGIVTWVEPWLKKYQKIEKRGNVELISHSYTHMKMSEENKPSSSDLEHEITDSIAWYKEHFSTDQIAFTPPENTMCEEGYQYLEKNGIRAMRQGGRDFNDTAPQNGYEGYQWYNLYTFGIGDVTTTEERNAWVEGAIENKKWLIEMWHNVTEDGNQGGYQEISYDMADEHLNYIAGRQNDGQIWVASMVDASKYLLEKEYAVVSATYNDSKLTVSLCYDENELNPEIYAEPLTVRILLPEEVSGCSKATSSDRKNPVRILEDGEETYLEFEMIPNIENTTIKLK